MIRAWDEWIADLADGIRGGVGTLALLSVLAALLIALAWYFWPAWLPWRWRWRRARRDQDRPRERRRRSGRRRRLGRMRWRLRWRRRKRGTPAQDVSVLGEDTVPDLPSELLALTADQLAAAGRYAEAVRERLRAMLRGLIERDLLPSSAGWTVMELVAAGAHARATLRGPLAAAAGLFSEIWYGLRPATAADDAAMRVYASAVAQVAASAEPQAVGNTSGGSG